jgi:hypothetical protein
MSGPAKPDETGESAESRIRAAAARALAEAKARREAAAAQTSGAREIGPRELGGRDGPEPVRYGDWEVKGIASDF